MTEKVLGFKERNVKIKLEGTSGETYQVHYKKLVPVVSLEWLEDYCKENEQSAILNVGKKFALVIPTKDLLSAARREAGEKK